jgi:N-acetyl-gamma-glutamyl-phosphate reductase
MGHNKGINIAILGASGYTGSELIRLLSRHPFVSIKALGAERKAGQKIIDVFPHLSVINLPDFVSNEDIDYTSIDAVFCALPHGVTQTVVKKLPKHVKVIDLSADFRLRNLDDYQKYYGHVHQAPLLQQEFVYGLPEFYRADISKAHYVANTGCYVASSLLALLPLVASKAIQFNNIIIDAKSGATGAGRSPSEATLFTEINDGFKAYATSGHRHSGEINQELTAIAGVPIQPIFTPHLLPQNRGILSTIYGHLSDGVTVENIHNILDNHYKNEYFIKVLPFGVTPQTQFVKGSNFVMLGVSKTPDPHKVIIVSCLDNLIKGASGQAIQNFNLMFGIDEITGLEQLPLFP